MFCEANGRRKTSKVKIRREGNENGMKKEIHMSFKGDEERENVEDTQEFTRRTFWILFHFSFFSFHFSFHPPVHSLFHFILNSCEGEEVDSKSTFHLSHCLSTYNLEMESEMQGRGKEESQQRSIFRERTFLSFLFFNFKGRKIQLFSCLSCF